MTEQSTKRKQTQMQRKKKNVKKVLPAALPCTPQQVRRHPGAGRRGADVRLPPPRAGRHRGRAVPRGRGGRGPGVHPGALLPAPRPRRGSLGQLPHCSNEPELGDLTHFRVEN